MDMHESHGGTDLLAPPEPPAPDRRPPRRARFGRGFVAALIAAALVLLGANAATVYFAHRISLDETIERVEPVR
jgi:hypothetical protein